MDEALTPGTRLGPYEIVALIGSGGMGTVYRAHDSRLARHVAIKTLSASAAADPDTLRRFETEAKAAGTLDHPNLLVVYDVGHEGAVAYIVAELLDGETLRERLRRQGAMPERQVIECAQQIVRGLTAAHARGIVHRDLKPENLFLTRDRRLKILDFGVAKVLRRSPANTLASMVTENMTALGVIVGTVGYMAPEQAMGDVIDHRADIFAFGAVMYEMASGTQPFQRNTAISTLTAILEDDPPELPSTVTAGLAQIIRRCLEKRPDDRFQTTHDLGLALDLLTTTTAVGAVATVPRPSNGLSRRQVLTYGASSIALLASGAAAANVIGGHGRADGPPSYRRLTFRRGLVRSARVAPDGETIFYGALWDGEQCRAHSVRIDSPESRPLDLPDANVLAISRSGNLALALGPHLDGVITYGTLATVPVAGGAPRQMVEGVKFADWSPDGSELAIVRRGDGGDRLEYPIGNVLVDPSSGKATGIGFARVSPDGQRVAFIHYRTPGSLVGRVSIVDKNRTITTLSDEYLNIHGLAWRGDEIWYTAADDRPLFRGLCAVKPGDAPRTVTRTPGNATLWDAMPDGRLVVAQTDDRAAMITQLPGENTDHDLSWLDASWVADISRDGRTLLFTETG